MATVQNHSKTIIELLGTLPDWVDFPSDPAKWTPEQIEARLPVWRIWPAGWRSNERPFPLESGWCAFCYGKVFGWDPRGSIVISSAPGSMGPHAATVETIRSRKPTVLPHQGIVEALARTAASHCGRGAEVLIVRNEWMERKELVEQVRRQIKALAAETRRCLVQASLDPAPLDDLLASDYMQNDLVDRAIAVMTKSLPAPAFQAEIRSGPPSRLTGKDAAELIGVTESTFSRWRGDAPIWATSNDLLFKSLVERQSDGFPRQNIVKLAAWWKEAMKSGGQEPTPCP
jgi:hypothetical protein